jgi:A/G-specific adenine glycosylase
MKGDSIVKHSGHPISLSGFHHDLGRWGLEHRRDFPWRSEKDPYRILIAELMLIQTQAQQVVPVYNEFISAFPTIRAASSASRGDFHNHMDRLGLTWRADKAYEAVQMIFREYDGRVPESRVDLKSLPGVSAYVAAAVRCFAYGIAEPIVDTNTLRITSRLFNLKTDRRPRDSSKLKDAISDLIDEDSPVLYNYSLLDLGALICTNSDPCCGECPILQHCEYGLDATDSAELI